MVFQAFPLLMPAKFYMAKQLGRVSQTHNTQVLSEINIVVCGQACYTFLQRQR